MNGGCTIVSPNYLAYARTLAESFLAQHPDHRFFVLIVADLNDVKAFEVDVFTPVALGEIGLHDVKSLGMMYEILELNTNVKATFLKFLLARFDLETLVYLDPDIFVYSPLTPVFRALETASAVLTPHMTQPVNDGKEPGEQEMLYNGTYNLGFFALRRGEEAGRLLDWWEERCLECGFSEGRTGLFVDQKWMNLAPGMFEGVAILRHPGCNMAFWNLHERRLSREVNGFVVNGTAPLLFFHFSGVVLEDSDVLSKNTNRYMLSDRPDLQPMFAAYRTAVRGNRNAVLEATPYGLDTLTDGTAVTRLARRIYAKQRERWPGQDPFDASGGFARFAKDLGLVKGKSAPPKQTWREFSGTDRRVEMVHRLLRIALRVLGPHRYELLMRYLGHISVLRNQSVFLDDRQR